MKFIVTIIIIVLAISIFLDVRENHRQWLKKEGQQLREENQRLIDETYELRRRHAELWKEKNFWIREANRRGKEE